MRDQLAHAFWQARTPRAPQLGVLRERLGLVTQLLAEGLGPGRIVATNVLDDSPQILVRLGPPFDAVQSQPTHARAFRIGFF